MKKKLVADMSNPLLCKSYSLNDEKIFENTETGNKFHIFIP